MESEEGSWTVSPRQGAPAAGSGSRAQDILGRCLCNAFLEFLKQRSAEALAKDAAEAEVEAEPGDDEPKPS